MMSLSQSETQTLGTIEHGLAGSDPRLASMLTIFTRRHPRRGTARPQARRLYPRLGRQQAILLLWAVTTAALLTIALLLNTGGHDACIQSIGTTCPSPPSHSGPGSTFG